MRPVLECLLLCTALSVVLQMFVVGSELVLVQ